MITINIWQPGILGKWFIRSILVRYKPGIYSIFTRYKLALLDRRNAEEIAAIFRQNIVPVLSLAPITWLFPIHFPLP